MRGQHNVSKVHTLKCAAYNLGLLLRKVWGFCKPRNAEATAGAFFCVLCLLVAAIALVVRQHADWTITFWLGGCGMLLVTLIAAHQIHSAFTSREK